MRARSKAGAVLEDEAQVIAQVLSIIKDQTVVSYDGKPIPMPAQSICIHGDNPAAESILIALHQAFEAHNISLS